MDFGQLIERIHRWTLRFSKLSPERQAREEPLRAGLLRRILAGCFFALILQAALFIYRGGGLQRFLFWLSWGTIEPLVLLLIAVWFERKPRISLASILAVIALSHIAAFTRVQLSQPHLTRSL